MKKVVLTIGAPGAGKSTWATEQAKNPKVFITHYNELNLMNQCKVKAFIQVRDKELYSKLEKLLEQN